MSFNIHEAMKRAARCPTPMAAWTSAMVQIGLDDDYADYYADNIKGEHEPFPPSLEKEWYGLSQEDRYLLVSEWISEEVKSYGEMRVG